jgi:hypothetical protein
LLLLAVFACPAPVWATDDVVPFFAGRTGSPNVMILFDNSNSMQDSPYFRADGNIYTPSTHWRRGVEINPDCDVDTPGNQPCIAEDSNGHIIYDQTKYVTTSMDLTLPGRNPPNLPGLSSSGSTITSFQSSSPCPAPNASLTCSDRIYDTNLDWSLVADWSDFVPYRYWKVRVTDQTNNSVQYRTIESRSSGSGYWRVYEDDLQYDPAHTYSYEIVGGLPGEVTHRHNDHFDRVYDRDFDWSAVVDWSDFETNYRHKILEVYAGTNSGLRREIYSRNIDYGYWRVANSFPVPCDDTTRYRILGAADDNKYASGGNHPDSKMYQAKLALQKFLTSGAIKTTDTDANGNTTDRYLMNIGFATFLQARVPITRAKYYRKIAAVAEVPGYTIPAHTEHHDAEFSYLYRYHNDHTPSPIYLPTGCVNGNPPAVVDPLVNPGNWTQTYNNVTNGGTVDRTWNSGCREQTITYLVTYTCAPTDSLPGRVKVQLASWVDWETNPPSGHTSAELAGLDPDGNPQWGYTDYTWRTFYESDNTHTCETYSPPDPYNGWAYLVQNGESCYEECETVPAYDEDVPEEVVPPIPARDAYYITTWQDTWGDLRKADPLTPKYIERNPALDARYIVTPYKGWCSNDGWNCTNPNPDSGEWTLITDTNEQINVCLGIDSTTGVCNEFGDLTKIIFDYSRYRYPGRTDDTDHSHGWSYKKTIRDPDWLTSWRYRKDDGTYLTDDHFIYASGQSYPSNWPDTIQSDPFFPSVSADDFANYLGDDQVVFVDLPEFNDADQNKGDDVSGNHIQKVLNYINLARVEYPRDRRYVWTMAPISKDSLTVNRYEDETGSGTPLAATLADARKYLTSYMQQDEYSLGGCRKNYVILLTDGTETAGGDPVAEAVALQHIVVNGEEHPIKVYVIGFGLDAAAQIQLDAIAQAGGSALHGSVPDQHYAYFANNVDELVSILAHDITSDILGGSYGRGKATLTPGSQQGVSGDLALYNAYFDYPVWRGHVEAWGLYPEDVYDVNGNLLHRAGSLKVDAGGNKIGELNWSDGCGGTAPSDPGSPDAGCIMAEANMDPGSPPDGPLTRRTLYTTKITDGSRIEFSPANIVVLKDLVNPLVTDTDGDGTPDAGVDIDGDTFAGTDLDAKAIINYIHHPGFDNADYVGTRADDWPLADIYNSGPILVTAPRKADCLDSNNDGMLDPGSWLSMDGYCTFAESHKNREGMLYVGTNGGMIEGITAGQHNVPLTGGREKWGYLPSFVLPKLQEIKEGHRFTMDLTVMASEVDTSVGLDGTGWKTMLVAGQRKGGNNYVALDVTDPDNPQPMWEFSDGNLGQTWSRPEVARIEIAGVKTSVLIFGGGYSPNADVGNRIYIVRASDGTILDEITVGAQANNIPGRITLMPYLVDNTGNIVDYRTNTAKLPDGTPVDYSNRYNFIEVGYFGDTSGDVYRLDGLNSKNGELWNPHVTKLYHPDEDHARPIYYAPVITDIKKGMIDNGTMTGCVKRYVLVGTGNEHDPIATKKPDFSPMLDYFMEIEDAGDSSAATDETYLDWRFNLGMQLPLDQYGFLLKPDGSKAKKDTNGDGSGDKDILSKYIYLANPADGFTVNVNGQLINSDNEIVAMPGNYYFKDAAGNLYSDTALTLMIAGAGTYVQVDTSLWLTDVYGWFYDSEDGVKILDTTLYSYDNDGFMLVGTDKITPGGAVCDPANDACVKVVSDPGEKILSQPVGYGRYIYFTTYTPVGGCSTGTSYFYGLKTSSCESLGGAGTLNYSKVGEGLVPGLRRRIRLGKGISPGPTLGGGTAYVPLYSPGNPPEINAIPVTVGETRLKYWKQN